MKTRLLIGFSLVVLCCTAHAQAFVVGNDTFKILKGITCNTLLHRAEINDVLPDSMIKKLYNGKYAIVYDNTVLLPCQLLCIKNGKLSYTYYYSEFGSRYKYVLYSGGKEHYTFSSLSAVNKYKGFIAISKNNRVVRSYETDEKGERFINMVKHYGRQKNNTFFEKKDIDIPIPAKFKKLSIMGNNPVLINN